MTSDTYNAATALIADDEPLLLAALRKELNVAWPELSIVAEASNGDQALQRLREPGIDIAFLDIQMPGMTGLEVAQELLRSWPASEGEMISAPPSLLVFVTAYGEFALEAFESAAIDYVLKPVTPDRMSLTIKRLQARLHERAAAPVNVNKSALQALALQLTQLAAEQAILPKAQQPEYLKLIRAGVGDSVRMIPVEQVVLFEASDKYVVVHTTQGESLIRESLRELSNQLDPVQFQQIHRGSVVNMRSVRAALRDEHGKCVLQLEGIDKQPAVSRNYAHLFKAM